MIDHLIGLLGSSIESEEIKSVFTNWRALYPEKTTINPSRPTPMAKVEKDCVRLHFGLGGNSKHMKPIPSEWKDTYIMMLTAIEFTRKRKGGIPFDIEFSMTDDELTSVLGKPKVIKGEIPTKFWKKTYLKKYELVVSEVIMDPKTIVRKMVVTFKHEDGLENYEDYNQLE